jgi:hypothetical protein
MSEEKKEFTVKDKRIFSDENQDAEEQKDTAEDTGKPETPAEDEAIPPDDRSKGTDESDAYALPEMNFPTFVISMNASALLHLGVIEDPTTGKKEKNLPMAKQTIDLLSMLEEKTKGNLTEDEEGMLKNILYDLRIIYVKEMG